MTNLIRHLARRHAVFLFMSCLLLSGFEFVLCAIVSSVDIGGTLGALMSSLPPLLQSAIGSDLLGGMTERGMLAFGWNHPIAQALGVSVAIVLGSRAIAGEVESGTIELILSQPLSRAEYLATHVTFGLGALGLLTAVGIAGSLAGQAVFDLEPFRPAAAARLALAYCLLQAAWFGVALALSSFAREGGWVATSSFLLALTSYLVQVIGRLWPAAEFLLPWTLHDYYSPQAILVRGELAARSIALLAAVLAAGLAVASWRFARRDLP